MNGLRAQVSASRVVVPALDAGASWRRLDLSVTRDIWCLVDAEDYPWIIAHHWNWGWHAKTAWKHYAKRNVGAARSTIYLHREILRRADGEQGAPPGEDFYAAHHGDHINGQSLDNRRANLRWLTPPQNRAHRIARAAIPSLPSIVARLARAAPALAEVPF